MASVTTSPLGLLLFPLLLLQLAAADRLLSQQLTSPADSCGRIHPACLACGASNRFESCTSCSPVRYVVANGTCGEFRLHRPVHCPAWLLLPGEASCQSVHVSSPPTNSPAAYTPWPCQHTTLTTLCADVICCLRVHRTFGQCPAVGVTTSLPPAAQAPAHPALKA